MPTAGVTGVLPTEIFSQTARPAAYMIAGSMMWINLFIMGMIFPFLVVGEKHTHTNGSRVAQRSKALHLSARGVTTDPGSIPGCITTGREWESHRAAHNCSGFGLIVIHFPHQSGAPEGRSGLRHCISVLEASLQTLVRSWAVS